MKKDRKRRDIFGMTILLLCLAAALFVLARLIAAGLFFAKQSEMPNPTAQQPQKVQRQVKHVEYVPEDFESPEPEVVLTQEEQIKLYVDDICTTYTNVRPEIVKAMIYVESRYQPDIVNYSGEFFGLMQVGMKYHSGRAERLGVRDILDPYGNILVGVDYLSELIDIYHNEAFSIMCYNLGPGDARTLWDQGTVNNYTKTVLALSEGYKENEGELNG